MTRALFTLLMDYDAIYQLLLCLVASRTTEAKAGI